MYDTLIRELTHLKDRLDQTTSVNGSPQPIHEDLARLLATLRGDMRQKHLAMESTIEGLSILNDGVYTYMNMSHATMYDYEPDQLLGKSWTVLYSPAEIERLEREVFPVLPVHGTWTGETRGTSRTGRIVEGEITLTLLEGNGLVCTCHDISARKRLERSRLIASRRLELAADAAGFGIWELEVTTGRMHWDERMFAIYGLEPRSHPVTFEQWSTLLVEEDRVAMMDAAEGLIAGRVEAEVSFRIRRKDGEIRYIRSAATLVGKSDDPRDRDDIRLIGVNWDDTRLQTAAIEVQRNAEVLRRTNEELVRALRARDEFLATVSHELRTPLNAILGFSELLLEGVHGDLNPKQQTSLNIIDENGRHLLALINDILDISKIDAGMLTLQYDRVAPQLIADGVVKTFWRIAEEKGLRLVVEMSPSLSPIWVDPVRLKQILHNLVSNAVKFTPPRGVVTLRALVDPMRDALVFEVEDTGIGIDPVDIHAIFQPFVQLDAGLDRRFGGTGLGLSLVRMLVAAHGGSIAVKSEAGRGSCFSVTLPRHHRSESPAQLSPASKSPVSAARTREPDRRPDDESPVVLVAEDNEANWQFMQIFLESMGCRAVRAADGAEAVKKALELSPPLILMDIQMPGMDGLEAIRRIRSTGGTGAKPRRIVAVTALALPGDRDRCLQAGADQYLSKPVDLAVLRATIRSVTAAAGSSAGAARSTTAARPG